MSTFSFQYNHLNFLTQYLPFLLLMYICHVKCPAWQPERAFSRGDNPWAELFEDNHVSRTSVVFIITCFVQHFILIIFSMPYLPIFLNPFSIVYYNEINPVVSHIGDSLFDTETRGLVHIYKTTTFAFAIKFNANNGLANFNLALQLKLLFLLCI